MLNILQFQKFDSTRFSEKYKIFKIVQTSDIPLSISKGAEAFIYSTAFVSKNEFYILTPWNVPVSVVHAAFNQQNIIINETKRSSLPERYLLTLLINKTANTELAFNNLTASLYSIYKKKKDQVIALCFSVTNECLLTCKVSTFSKLNEKTLNRFPRKTQRKIEKEGLPFYDIKEEYVARSFGNKTGYINRSYNPASKNRIDFFTLDSSDNKLARMAQLIRAVNNENYAFAAIGFWPADYENVMREKRVSPNKFNKYLLSELGSDISLNIVDHCGMEDKIRKVMDSFGIPYHISTDIVDDKLNISIIKNIEEYKDTEDKYTATKTVPVQNIEYSNFTSTTLRQALLELVIKKEAVTKQINTILLPGEWLFLQYLNKALHMLKINDSKIVSLSALNIPDELQGIMEKHKEADPRMIGHNGCFLLICNTDLRLMPDWDHYISSQNMYKENGKNRARSYRNTLFGETIDINSFSYNGKYYYCVGEIGYGMNTSINNSPATKEIIENGLCIQDCLFMMKPNMYQINKYAVYPYPFKLLKELFVINGGVIEDE